MSLLSFQQASESLKPLSVSVRSLRRFASKETPIKRRLKVVRLGHRTVGIRPQDLSVWIARCAGEEI